MLKFEIKTKNHHGDKRTYLRYETTNVQDVLDAYDMKEMKPENLRLLLDGKFKALRMGTSVRISNLTPEIKQMILNIIGE